MKKLQLLIASLLFSGTMQAKNLKALFDYKTFYAPAQGSYVETYLAVQGNSVAYVKNGDGKFESSLEITVVLKNNDKIIHADKYHLSGPLLSDTLKTMDFLDCQRIKIPNGMSVLSLTIADKNNNGQEFNLSQEIHTSYNEQQQAVSAIELVSSFSKTAETEGVLVKNGFEITPRVDNFYPQSISKLKFYFEIYNTDKLTDDLVLLSYYLQAAGSDMPMNNFGSMQRKTVSTVIPVLSEIDIADLPSGNYDLVVQVKDKNNNLLASNKLFFQRSNAVASSFVNTFTQNTFVELYTDKKILAEDISSLQPISDAQQSEFISNQLKAADLQMMKSFFLNFWQRQDPIEPQKAWQAYKEKVNLVQNKYGSRALKGYNTDMGRVYLTYGQPDNINKSEMEPNTYPYEIWHYNTIKNKTNKMFIFYNTDMMARNYKLLHSDMPGEPYDGAWNLKLHARTTPSKNIDDEGTNIRNNYSGDKTNNNSINK
jgi:GWxTD domain-containing protein